MFLLTAILSLLSLLAPASQQPGPCVAYQKGGDVWYQCGATARQVTHNGKLSGFAIADGMIALLQADNSVRIVDLASGRVVERIPRTGRDRPFTLFVFTSCGSLLSAWGYPSGPYSTVALPSRKVIATLPCLSERLPPKADIPDLYRASSRGTFLLSLQDTEVCLSSGQGPPHCKPTKPGLRGFSVSEAGELVYGDDWGGQCFNSDYGAESPLSAPHPPGFDSAARPCTGVFLWKPGMSGPRLLAPYAVDPQWLEPKDSAALALFTTREGGPGKAGHQK